MLRRVYTSTRSRIRIQITIHNGGGGLSLDLNPVCLCVNVTNQDLDQNPRVNGAIDVHTVYLLKIRHPLALGTVTAHA